MEVYLGDGVYAKWSSYSSTFGELELRTSNGIRDTNTIVLGTFEIESLLEFLKQNGVIK